MATWLITGGNSGIGLEIARELAAQQHQVVLLGRDPAKNEAAVRQLGSGARAHAVDLSTNAGVRAAAEKAGAVDGVIHAAGMLTMKDLRTEDDLNPVFAVNYLSRYHLTQRLLPRVKKVIFIVAGVPLDTKIDFDRFPRFKPWPGMRALQQVQIANHHFAQALAGQGVQAGVCNVGLVKTEIMRAMPLPIRVGFAVAVPLIGVSLQTAAANPVWLATRDGWPSGTYWPKPGKRDVSQKLAFDAAAVEKVVTESRALVA